MLLSVFSFLLFIIALSSISLAEADQKLSGPSFELPTHVLSNKAIQEAVLSIRSSLNGAIRTGRSHFGRFNSSTTSFSLTAVSQLESTPIIDFHHTSNFLNVSAGSRSKVTSDTVYQISSVSKLFTVYSLFLNNGTNYWNRPVTDFIPELRQASHPPLHKSSVVDRVQWDQTTVGALASQLSGIGRDYSSGDLSSQDFPWTELGLPALPPQDIPSCGINDNQLPCSRKGKSYEELVKKEIFEPLGMKHSSPLPPIGRGIGIIPNGDAGWGREYGDEIATGGLLSSTNDLTKFGCAIFADKQLPSMETLRWMKPSSLTSSTSLFLGAPWEIVRTRSGIKTGHLIDLYTKSGSVGSYESLLILIPDYQVTLAVLAAGPDASAALRAVTETAIQTLLPSLKKAAKAESCSKLCGDYAPAGASRNSSLAITVDDGPSLLVKEWIHQGHDLIAAGQAYANATRGGKIQALRLYPTGLRTRRQAAYRVLFESIPCQYDPSVYLVFDPKAGVWGKLDQLMYGGIAVDGFVFHLNSGGDSAAVEPRVLREVYQRLEKSYVCSRVQLHKTI
ncbi:beta-lactamase transpeptidase [Trichoderma arundinaceum]|uniref:Beta-lactamase transpeptidase n=1 Tax=Trichoderma arundinaceum TaxID=490622 RepID=A0A395NQW3_TRIAR|nr:beta-lactamase transpeptidase [Trichoderma arundinaceum]